MAETFADGREEGEKSVLETVQKYIVGSSNVSDDASFGVMFFEGTQAPDTSTLESEAAKFASSSETFKDLSLAIKPEIIKAHEIISKCAGEDPVEAQAQPEPGPEKAPEPEVVAADKKEPEVEVKEPSKISKISIIMLIIGVVLCIIGAIELVLSLKG